MDSMGYNQEQMVENGRLYAAGDQMSRVKGTADKLIRKSA